MVLYMSSVKTTNLVQIKPNIELYQILSYKLLVVQRVKGLASEARYSFGVHGGSRKGKDTHAQWCRHPSALKHDTLRV